MIRVGTGRIAIGDRNAARRAAFEMSIGLLVAAALLYCLTTASSRFTGPLVIALPVGAVVSGYLFLNARIELSLAVLMVYLGVLDGYLKLSTGNSTVSAGRDVLLYAIVAGILVRACVTGARFEIPRYTAHVALFAVLVLAQGLNPNTPGLHGALGGAKQHLEFVPLFFLGYACMRSEKRLQWFFVLLLGIAAANAVAAVIQYNLTPEQFAAWGPGYADRILGQGSFAGSARTFGDL